MATRKWLNLNDRGTSFNLYVVI